MTLSANLRRWLGVLALISVLLPAAHAQNPVAFPLSTTPVTLDGTPMPARNNSVVHDGAKYHMWVVATSRISGFVHATSDDGIHFTTQGTLAPPDRYWQQFPCGLQAPAASEPVAPFVRVSQVNGEWIMMVWHQAQAGHPRYNGNTSVWRIGVDPSNRAVTQFGSLPHTSNPCATASAPGGNHAGVFGMIGSRIYLRHSSASSGLVGSVGGNLGAYTITLTAPPTTSLRPSADPTTYEANLFAGTNFHETLPVPPAKVRAYVENAGRTLEQANGTIIGTYYSFDGYDTGSPYEKDLWYVESTNGGVTWSQPQRIYGPLGTQVLVNGLPNTGNFSAPEVTANGRTYFFTTDACGRRVMVTAADAATDPRLAIAKQFQPAAVTLGAVSQLSITLQAPPASCSPAPATPVVSNLAFIDTLPAGLSPTGSVVSNTCTGSTVTAPANGASVSVQGVALAMGASCTVTVEVRANAVGAHENRISVAAVSNTQNLAPAQNATATLTVTTAAGSVQAVPATEPLSLAALAALLAGAAWRRRRS